MGLHWVKEKNPLQCKRLLKNFAETVENLTNAANEYLICCFPRKTKNSSLKILSGGRYSKSALKRSIFWVVMLFCLLKLSVLFFGKVERPADISFSDKLVHFLVRFDEFSIFFMKRFVSTFLNLFL